MGRQCLFVTLFVIEIGPTGQEAIIVELFDML